MLAARLLFFLLNAIIEPIAELKRENTFIRTCCIEAIIEPIAELKPQCIGVVVGLAGKAIIEPIAELKQYVGAKPIEVISAIIEPIAELKQYQDVSALVERYML